MRIFRTLPAGVLQPLLRGRTSLVIADRLSTVLSADVILVLDHGRLAEHGTHTELVDRGGLYVDGCDWSRKSGCGRWRA